MNDGFILSSLSKNQGLGRATHTESNLTCSGLIMICARRAASRMQLLLLRPAEKVMFLCSDNISAQPTTLNQF